jgi:hypothetical protein
MNAAMARLLTRIYPRRWRERYGQEFQAHLETSSADFFALVNVLSGALSERMFPTRGSIMERTTLAFGDIIKQPGALIPLGMSLVALTTVLGFLLANGVVHATDEGAVAHIWQLLMAGQFPIVLFFAVKWLPRAPRQTLPVLALQCGAALVSMAPVFVFHL